MSKLTVKGVRVRGGSGFIAKHLVGGLFEASPDNMVCGLFLTKEPDPEQARSWATRTRLWEEYFPLRLSSCILGKGS